MPRNSERRGFASMDPDERRQIARRGGEASHGGRGGYRNYEEDQYEDDDYDQDEYDEDEDDDYDVQGSYDEYDEDEGFCIHGVGVFRTYLLFSVSAREYFLQGFL